MMNVKKQAKQSRKTHIVCKQDMTCGDITEKEMSPQVISYI